MNNLKDIILELDNLLTNRIKDKLKLRGHHLTGGLQNSFEYTLSETDDELILTRTAAKHLDYIEKPTKSFKFTLSPRGRGGNKKSKLVEAMQDYWKKRKGLSEKESLSAAIATIRKWKKEGRSTVNSRKYSGDNKRNFPVRDSIAEVEQEMDDLLDLRITELIDSYVL